MFDASVDRSEIDTENICDCNFLKSLIEERDKREKLPFENLIFTSKNKRINLIIIILTLLLQSMNMLQSWNRL